MTTIRVPDQTNARQDNATLAHSAWLMGTITWAQYRDWLRSNLETLPLACGE